MSSKLTSKRSALVWFRNDLRICDNPALYHACQNIAAGEYDEVKAVFFVCADQWSQHDMAPIKAQFTYHNLVSLQQDLAQLGIALEIEAVSDFTAVPRALTRLFETHNIQHLFVNREYAVNEVERDNLVYQACESLGVIGHWYDDQSVLPPGSVMTKQGTPYSVFTPYSNTWRGIYESGGFEPLPQPCAIAECIAQDQLPLIESNWFDLASDHFEASAYQLASKVKDWQAGEENALAKLDAYIDEKIDQYKQVRDFPSIDGTSQLSPYLALGVISAKYCIAKAYFELNLRIKESDENARNNIHCWISELIWRDFYIHVMAANPQIVKGRAFKEATEAVPWRDDEASFSAWCEGRTGIPIIDAAMRQLLATGWMHNRLRMICAMFLTKNLLIDWRKGEAFFMRHLIDGQFAANNGGWQWSASTGTDAAPYFRIFNPVTQSERFDPDGKFIRHYVPELEGLDKKAIHCPPDKVRGVLGYPKAIVDLKSSRVRAIDTFKAALN